jgi:glycosyltransferase involved in cell wall biosynthesis
MTMVNHPNVVLATPTWSLNGANVFSANLTRGLNARGIPAQIVLTRPDWIDVKPLPRPADIRFRSLPVKRFASLTTRWRATIQYLSECAPCIYIPNHDFGHSCVSSRLPDSVATIGIVHSDDPQHYEHVARLGMYWNAVVAVSIAIGAEILKIDPSLAPRLSVIPYGVTAAKYLPDRSSQTGRPLRVIYAGRLDQAQKRVLDLPEIAKAAARLSIPLQMTIAGSGPAEAQLRARFAAIGAGARVDFLGTLDSGALQTVLMQHDVFLLTSAFEGLPMGLLEAMGQGCVPLAPNIRSGVSELIESGRNGFRATVGDVREFAERLAELFHNPPLRRRMAEAAYVTVRSSPYRLEDMVQRYVELSAKVLDEARSGVFHRPRGAIRPPPDLPWQEYLPGPLQKAGHCGKRLMARAWS